MEDPLAKPVVPTLSLVSNTKVQNEFPTSDVPYSLAIVGEAPGADEEAYGRPFIGASGRLLDSILSGAGILRAGCFVGNVCKRRPPGNKIEEWGYDHPFVLEGWEELKSELRQFNPHCILALGNTPLHFLYNRTGITSWRGSILGTDFGKVVPSIHPAAILREYKDWPLLRFDALRARSEAESPVLNLPQRTLELDLTADEICNRLDNWPAGQLLSFDIEGGLDAFPCCSVADAGNRGFIIAFGRHSPDDQGRLYVSLSRCLYRIDVPKVLQNSLYDRFVLAYGYKMLIRNVVDDTMLKHWEIYPESSGKKEDETGKAKRGTGKNLSLITSIWTREPHYKSGLMIYSQAELKRQKEAGTYDPNIAQENKYKGCVLDSCVTLEANLAMSKALDGNAARHYKFNVGLLSPLLYMELRGLRYDRETASQELGTVKAALAECTSRLALRAGYDLCGAKGSISATKLKRCLYSEKGYPEQKTGRGPTAKVTTDVEALLNLSKKFPNDPFLSDILLHRKLESIQETLEISADSDGRVRCGYNLVGTETGRLTCYTSPTGSGANLQTITKKLRKLYLADEGHWMFQCDLSGADGWTVAAHCLRHGDPTMWDDYLYGLKPARLGALFYTHPEYVGAPRDELKDLCKTHVDDDGWMYFAFKRIQHATNYLVQERTVSKQIMVDSYKITGTPVYVDPPTCAAFQRVYLARYKGLYAYHHWARREVAEGRNLTTSAGHTRTFFGRRKSWDAKKRCVDADHDTLKEYLASEPQFNTTYATNLAMHNLWSDPANRIRTERGCALRVEPLHQVHDALIGQFRMEDSDWAIQKIRSWFNNKIHIANSEVTIPFEGHYGRSWGELKTGTI